MPRPDITEWAGVLFRRQLNRVLDYLDGLAVIDGDKGDVTVSGSTWTIDNNAVKTALNAAGSAPIYACRAWVNFDGTGTVAIRASGNVSSVTDNGVANYTVNLTTAMQDTNYTAIAAAANAGVSLIANVNAQNRFTGSFQIFPVINDAGTSVDATVVEAALFR